MSSIELKYNSLFNNLIKIKFKLFKNLTFYLNYAINISLPLAYFGADLRAISRGSFTASLHPPPKKRKNP